MIKIKHKFYLNLDKISPKFGKMNKILLEFHDNQICHLLSIKLNYRGKYIVAVLSVLLSYPFTPFETGQMAFGLESDIDSQ